MVFLLNISFIFVFFSSCAKEATSKPTYIFKPAPRKGVVAKVKEREIPYEEFVKGIENDLYQAEMAVYKIKMNRLNAFLLQEFMDADPKKKGLTNDQYLDKYINKGKTASEKDIEGFIKERKIPEKHMSDAMKKKIKKYLNAQIKKKAVDRWVAAQTQENPVEVYLSKPERPVFNVVLGEAPFFGKESAKVTLVEFSDFECPFCAKGADILKKVKEKYGDKIRVVFKNFPLPFHSHARRAAQAGLCANEQGRQFFWKLHDFMFANQRKLDEKSLFEAVKTVGINSDKFSTCLKSKKYAPQIEKDIEQGKSLGVKSTPSFFVNGKFVGGAQSFEIFTELIDEELKN